MDLHQRLQALRQRRLAAADRTEQIEDLLALLEALRGMAEKADDPFDRLFHAEEFVEGRIHPDSPVHEDAAEPWIARSIDKLRLPDSRKNAFRSPRIHHRIVAAACQIF